MSYSDQLIDEMLTEIDVLASWDADKYTLIENPIVSQVSDKAAFITCAAYADWTPFSQMKTNADGEIFLATWLYNLKVSK